MEQIAKMRTFFAATCPTFFILVSPASRNANPACMNITRIAATTTQIVLAAMVRSTVVTRTPPRRRGTTKKAPGLPRTLRHQCRSRARRRPREAGTVSQCRGSRKLDAIGYPKASADGWVSRTSASRGSPSASPAAAHTVNASQ